MKEYRVANESDRSRLIEAIMDLDINKPRAVSIKFAGGKRRAAQNSLMWLWNTYVGQLTGQTANEVHHQNKLNIGVPILARRDDSFAGAWATISEHCGYSEQLKIISRMDVTSQFRVADMVEYLSDYEHEYQGQGTPLPRPEDRYYEALALRMG